MGDVAQLDVVRVTAKMSFESTEDILNVYHMKHTGSASATDAAFSTAAATWLEVIYTTILSYLSDEVTFETIEFYNVTQDRPMAEIPWPTLTIGSDAGDALPLQCAALVSLPTGVKRVVGKKYIGGLTETNSINGGHVSAAAQTALAAFVVQLLNDYVSGTLTLTAGTYNDITAVFRELISGIVDQIFRSQRRRVRGVGS